MANYYGYTRTNYFVITDESKFRGLMARCAGSEGDVQIFEDERDIDKMGKFAFGCEGSISGIKILPEIGNDCDDSDCCDCDCDYDYDAFCAELQGLIAEDDAVLITEIGHEKLRYLSAHTMIITRSDIRVVQLENKAIAEAREMLGNPEFCTQNSY